MAKQMAKSHSPMRCPCAAHAQLMHTLAPPRPAVCRYWPVRRYPWGSCEAMLTAHSDAPALRRLLFETAYLELKRVSLA